MTSQNTTVFIDVNAPGPKFGRAEKSLKTQKNDSGRTLSTPRCSGPPPGTQNGAKMSPKWTQNGARMDLNLIVFLMWDKRAERREKREERREKIQKRMEKREERRGRR